MFILPRHPWVTWHWLLAFIPVGAFATPVSLPRFANFSYAPDTAKLKHSLRSIAFDIPCGTWNNAPIGLLIP